MRFRSQGRRNRTPRALPDGQAVSHLVLSHLESARTRLYAIYARRSGSWCSVRASGGTGGAQLGQQLTAEAVVIHLHGVARRWLEPEVGMIQLVLNGAA